MQHAGANALQRTPHLEVIVNGVPSESTLINVVVSSMPFRASRAIWDMSQVSEVVLSRVMPATIGFSALATALADRSERAYYRVYGTAATTFAEVVRVTGRSFQIEEGYEQAKGKVSLDQYEVRTWRAWYRYATLALLA